ncbi:MAG: hypothetical protein Q8L48_35940 [Archangium sp.]|nr:hypothetical protein [Archangium sp.]
MNATTLQKTDELINLEREVSEGNASPAVLRRLERLRHKNEKATLGLLAKALSSYEFRDDVLHTARLRDTKYLAECAKDAQWATVEVLDLGWNSLKRLGIATSDFLASMPLLHTLLIQAAQVPERPCPSITTLRLTGDLEIAVIAERFPGLTTLELDYVSQPAELWAHPFAQQLESVTVGSLTWKEDVLFLRPGGSSSVEWIAQGPALRRLEVQEEELHDERLWDLQQLFDAARRKGAEVVLLPEPGPRPSWRPRRYERWH